MKKRIEGIKMSIGKYISSTEIDSFKGDLVVYECMKTAGELAKYILEQRKSGQDLELFFNAFVSEDADEK